MGNYFLKNFSFKEKLLKLCKIMKFLVLFLCMFVYQSFSATMAQQTKVTLNCNSVSLEQIIMDLKKQTNLNYFYKKEDVSKYKNVTANFKNELLANVLKKVLKSTNLTFEINNNIILIKKSKLTYTSQVKKITGTVVDEKGNPLPGVTVVVKGTSQGISTDLNGKFKIDLPKAKDLALVFTFIGMESQTVKITNQTTLKVVMKEKASEIDEVVVNGYFERSKETFTGASTTVTGEQIKQISNTNLIQALAAITPGMYVVENNAQGSNPNAIPQIIIRGTTSLVDEDNADANNPLIVLDGVVISMEELYDLEIEDIDRIDVLKDAAATSIYGDEAANGVIVVTRKRVKDAKLKVRYNFTPNYAIPDITSIELTNAKQKLELERLAGLYETKDGSMDAAYQKKLNDVNNGVNTDWIAKPLRVSLSHNHSLSLSGRSNDLSYRVSGNFKDSYGVMKGDNRKGYGLNLYLGYFKSKKLRVSFRSSFSMSQSKNSPYGNFADYTKINPYNPVYDEYGDYIKQFYFDPVNQSGNPVDNPLYNASLSSFSKRKSLSVNNSVNAKWEVSKDLQLTSQLSYNTAFSYSDAFVSPDDSQYIKSTLIQRGSYKASASRRSGWSAKINARYRLMLGEQSYMTINAGAEAKKNKSNSHSTIGNGFKKDWMTDLDFALTTDGSGNERLSSSVGFYASTNLSYKMRYNFDFNARTSGSSKYGRDNKWGPFLSGGFSWNIHKESFMDFDWLNSLRFRVSSGYTGSSSFNPYQAITVYNYKDGYDQYTGIGAIPENMGNPDLKYQRTLNTNYGLTASILNNRISFGVDYYTQLTKDVVMSVDVPPSIGVKTVKVNYGELKNSGYDFNISGQIINNKDYYWAVSFTASHVMDRIEKISEEMVKNYSENNTYDNNAIKEPSLLLREGGSQYDIYGVRSAGVDPATGKEIYIDKNGNYTFEHSGDDVTVIGNTNPTLRGAINTNFRIKNFSVNVVSQYTFGSDKYNSTIFSKVENIDPYHNVDERAFTQRWKSPGDLTWFEGLREKANSNDYSSRFVQKYDEFYISNINFAYEFKPQFLKKWGVKKLRIAYGMTDILRLSTVKFERGTSYPYNRTFNISIRPTF